MDTDKKIRINKVLKDFDISLGTLNQFFKQKNMGIEATPVTKITVNEYNIIAREFGRMQNKIEYQECSKEVYDILVAFNNLPSPEQQDEVLDVIYDALYKNNYIKALSDTIVMSQETEIKELEEKLAELKTNYSYDIKQKDEAIRVQKIKNRNLAESLAQAGKKELRNKINGLLIIIGTLKHYLGDSWNTVFPGRVQDVDKYLRMADCQHILETDKWSMYENANLFDLNEESPINKEGGNEGAV